MNNFINITALAILSLLWLLFAAALVFKPGLLNTTWQAFRRLPLLVQMGIALPVLPVALGLGIWQTRWPAWLRLALVAGLAVANIYMFFPRPLA